MENIYKKLYALQTEIGAIGKSETNPFFKSKYFDINKLLSALKPMLKKHNLLILQPLTYLESRAAIKTVVVDVDSGEMIEDTTLLPNTTKPQDSGSAITYFRRYALQSLLLLEAEDDDGNKSSGTEAAYAKSKRQMPPAPTLEVNKNQIPF